MLQELIETEESGSDFGYAYRVFDNEDILLELDGSNNITTRYTHGPGIDEPLIMEKGGASFFYHADGLGSITEITDSTGALKPQYTYSSFGKIESQLDPNFIQPYTFTVDMTSTVNRGDFGFCLFSSLGSEETEPVTTTVDHADIRGAQSKSRLVLLIVFWCPLRLIALKTPISFSLDPPFSLWRAF